MRQITHPGAAAIAKRCYTNPAVSGPLCATPHGMEGIVAGGGLGCKLFLGQGLGAGKAAMNRRSPKEEGWRKAVRRDAPYVTTLLLSFGMYVIFG